MRSQPRLGGAGGCHAARRRSSSFGGDQEVERAVADREADAVAGLARPSGPPAAASGVTCRTMVPKAVPDMRQSLMRIMSLTPARPSLVGIGR